VDVRRCGVTLPTQPKIKGDGGQLPDLSTPQNKRLLLVAFAILVVGWVLWHARGALGPFLVGAVIAYLLAPIVEFIHQTMRLPVRFSGLSRAIAVIITYALVLLILVAAGYYLIPPLVSQTNQFIDNTPTYVDDVRVEMNRLNQYYEENLPEVVRTNIESNLDTVGSQLATTVRAAMKVTFSAVGTVIGFVAGLAVLPLWLFYVLKDQRRGIIWFYNLWPESWRADVREVVGIIDRILSAYIRVQLFLGVLIGVTTGVAMWLIGLNQAIALGLFAGIFELVPVLGPWLAFLVAALVTLATDPSKIPLVAIAFFGIQQLENTFLVPKLQGDALRINPAIIMMLLVIGGSVWGLVGVIVIVPITAALRDVFVYLYHRTDEPPEVSIEEV
jgi:predicted PurR-regulated permease PerM